MGKVETIDEAVLHDLRAWGGNAEMSAFEAVMWRAEVDPRLRSTTTSVLILDRAPDWPRLYAGHRWLVDAVPRFRQRVVSPAFGVGHPTWVEDPGFDLDYHLRRISLPAPGSDRQLFDLAQTLAMTPFDRARSPWEATLVEGLSGGRAGYVLKLHHATSDGLGIIQLMSRVLQRTPEGGGRPTPRRAAGTARDTTPAQLARQQLRAGLLGLPGEAAGTVSSLASGLRDWATRPAALKEAQRYLSSARRVLGTKPVKGSGLFKRRSLSWRFDAIEIPLVDLKAAAKAAEASVNDAFLAGLIGGFGRYHETMGVPVRRMPIGFPISLRSSDDPMGGNKFAGSQYAAPISERDPIARIRDIQRFVRETRQEPALDIMIRLMPAVTRLPLAAITAMTADFTTAQDAQISNIPGLTHPVYMAGAEVTHFWPFAPVPGCGMMIAMISHNGRCCIGINSDRAAVIEPELLIECFRAGLDEVLALGRPAGEERAAETKSKRKVK
ncbi:MAG: wax ester/triacylglycerol synthase domain-containing protein [Pseudomonadota bacterium]